MDITLQMSYVEGRWPQNCYRSKPTDYFTRVTQKLMKICIFLKNGLHPKILNVKIVRGEEPRNRYALTLQNMCIKGVGDTFLAVLFLPEVRRGRQNAICQQN